MNFNEAYERELKRGKRVIYSSIDEICHICRKLDELRVGVCFECKQFIETNMVEVWDRRKPEIKWPYQWQGPPREATEEEVRQAQKLGEQLSK